MSLSPSAAPLDQVSDRFTFHLHRLLSSSAVATTIELHELEVRLRASRLAPPHRLRADEPRLSRQ